MLYSFLSTAGISKIENEKNPNEKARFKIEFDELSNA
jgi:hypothetical protein